MSKFTPLKHLNADDFRTAPQWFRDYLDQYNILADALNFLLPGHIDIDWNLQAEKQTVTVSHNTPVTVNLQKLSTPTFCILGYCGGSVGVANIVGYPNPKSVSVNVFFLGTVPTNPVSAVLWLM